MTALELAANIGKLGSIPVNGLTVHVHIMDGKVSYGTPRYLVTPVSGTGSVWVDSSRVSFENSSSQYEQKDGQ